MRVIAFGGRSYDIRQMHWDWLDKLHEEYEITELIQGGASGADAGAKLWALRKAIDCTEFLCNWVKYGPSAGPRRNQRMLDYLLLGGGEVAGIMFPGGAGTKDCAQRLKTAKVHLFTYTGPKWVEPKD